MVVTVTSPKNYANLARYSALKPAQSLYVVFTGKRMFTMRPIRRSIRYRATSMKWRS